MGGNRPKNHVSAKYVIVIDRRQGFIYYYALDKSGVLIYENGQPKLECVLPYLVAAEKTAQDPNSDETTENTEDAKQGTEDAEDENTEVELKAPIVQANEANSDESDSGDPSDFQFYDEYNYENPFGFEDKWESFYFEY